MSNALVVLLWFLSVRLWPRPFAKKGFKTVSSSRDMTIHFPFVRACDRESKFIRRQGLQSLEALYSFRAILQGPSVDWHALFYIVVLSIISWLLGFWSTRLSTWSRLKGLDCLNRPHMRAAIVWPRNVSTGLRISLNCWNTAKAKASVLILERCF